MSQHGPAALYPHEGAPFRTIPAPSAAPREESSDFEKYVAGKSSLKLDFDIKQFGYDLFHGPQSSVTPVQKNVPVVPDHVLGPGNIAVQKDVPVGPDYVIGPGDQLSINVWGSIEGHWTVTVDRDGSVTLPKIGTLGVTGLSFKEVKEVLEKAYSKNYTGFQMNVSMGQLRTIRVYVVGKAKKVGAYTVSSLATLIGALQLCGGPSKVGSMRNIELKRNGKTITQLDLYNFLLTGSREGDVRLMPGDVIFIPTIGPMVGIAGNVKVPAIYELKGPTRISELIKLAGGSTAEAYMQRVQVERISNKSSRVIIDLNLAKLKGKEDIRLQDGDIVKVFPVTPKVINKVALTGNVWRPGEYQWRPGMRVSDVIRSSKDLLPESYLENVQIDRVVPPDYHMEYRTFNLGKVLFDHDESEDLVLKPWDVIHVFNKRQRVLMPEIRSAGALNRPGRFEYRENMKLSDLIALSGGLEYFALPHRAELTRITPTPNGPVTKRIIVDPASACAGNPRADILLKQNDFLFVRTIPDWELYKTVKIAGQVRFPGIYTFKQGERLSSVLIRAGGYTSNAYIRGTVFYRQSVQKSQQVEINRMVARLQHELMASGAANMSTAQSADDAKMMQQQAKQKEAFLASLKSVKANGRMIVHLEQIPKLEQSKYDVELENKDSIFVPTNPHTVQVIGAVYNQTGILYQAGKDSSFYISMAGGYTDNANKKAVYILRADGSALRPKANFFWDRLFHEWRVGYGAVEPGDTIVVPDKLEKVPWLRGVTDIASIVFNIATAAGIALAAGIR